MAANRDVLGEYVRQVRESTQRYARDLLSENEKLLGFATTVHAEKVRLEEQVEALKAQLERHRGVERSLIEQMSALEQTSQELSSRYLDVEQSNSNLANLYVASYGIHGSLDREEVVRAIHEVLVNLVGTEDFALVERSPCDGPFRVTSSMGVDAGRCARLRLDEGRIGRALSDGSMYVRAPECGEGVDDEEYMTACVPLMVGGRVLGAIVVFRLLSHKESLEPVDQELFELLATHAASALYCSELHGRSVR
jgi:hypothetical protein